MRSSNVISGTMIVIMVIVGLIIFWSVSLGEINPDNALLITVLQGVAIMTVCILAGVFGVHFLARAVNSRYERGQYLAGSFVAFAVVVATVVGFVEILNQYHAAMPLL